MWGGHGHRKFYLAEVSRIDQRHQSQIVKSEYTNDEIQAGFDRLGQKFGFYGTLLYLEKETPFNRKELLKWSVAEFNYNLVYLSHYNNTIKKYQEILDLKLKRGSV